MQFSNTILDYFYLLYMQKRCANCNFTAQNFCQNHRYASHSLGRQISRILQNYRSVHVSALSGCVQIADVQNPPLWRGIGEFVRYER